jgi:hypothetical protein
VYGSDSSIDWPHLCDNEYYELIEIIKRKDNGDEVTPTLSLTGNLLVVSIQTWTKMTEFEQVYSLTRYCRVIQHGEMHYNSSPSSTDSLGLEYPPVPGSHDDLHDNDHDHDAPYRTLRGHFNADYIFWSTEEDLQRELQKLTFFPLGVEHDGDSLSDDQSSTPCWVAGMVLKPIKHGDVFSKAHEVERYERIGWLRYCTEKGRDDFVPMGTKTKFLLV